METFKQEKKVDEKEEEKDTKPKFIHLFDEEEVEVKRLHRDDTGDCVNVMRKCAFDVTDAEVENIIKYGKSFGATVNRMLIGVGLAWEACLDVDEMVITNGEPNALYLEDPAVLLAYEGRGIRRILLKEREKEARERGLKYSMGYLYEDIPKGDISDYIIEAGSQLEKLYLSEEYQFSRTERGILAFKKLV